MSIINRLINSLLGLIGKRKADDFYLSDLVITEDDEATYKKWARRKNELVLQKHRSKRKS